MFQYAKIGLFFCWLCGTMALKEHIIHNNKIAESTRFGVTDLMRHAIDKRSAAAGFNPVLRGMKVVKMLLYKAKKLPYPQSKRFIIKYEKRGGIERLKDDFSNVKFDETRDFYMKNGRWGVVGNVGDRVVFAMFGGGAGESPTLRIVKAVDLDRHLRNKHVVLPREEIIYISEKTDI